MKKGRYYALDIADCVIQYCNSKKMPITNLALQKILYFIAGEFFKVSERDAIIEDFEAWKHGPVIPAVYDRFSVYGGSPLQPMNAEFAEISPEDKTIICGVVDEWMNRPYWELVKKTSETTPWKNTYSTFGRYARISKSSMNAYFKNGKNR